MPVHLEPVDVTPQLQEADSVLVAACNMCAGASLVKGDDDPFLRFFPHRLKSPPLMRYIRELETTLGAHGVKVGKFKAGIIQQFFLCLWTTRQRRKFEEAAKAFDAVIVLGCDSALDTARHALSNQAIPVIRGMDVAGIINTKTHFSFPGNIFLTTSQVATMCDHHCGRRPHAA